MKITSSINWPRFFCPIVHGCVLHTPVSNGEIYTKLLECMQVNEAKLFVTRCRYCKLARQLRRVISCGLALIALHNKAIDGADDEWITCGIFDAILVNSDLSATFILCQSRPPFLAQSNVNRCAYYPTPHTPLFPAPCVSLQCLCWAQIAVPL